MAVAQLETLGIKHTRMKKCTYCGKEYPEEATTCALDGQALEVVTVKPPELPKPSPKPDSIPVPAEVRRFNWAAFLLTWIWAACNGAFNAPTIILTILAIIPVVGWFVFTPILMFYCGFKGNENSWRLKRWDSVEQFLEVQRKWTRWTLIIIVPILLFAFFAVLMG